MHNEDWLRGAANRFGVLTASASLNLNCHYIKHLVGLV
jgi:hypothetical protein